MARNLNSVDTSIPMAKRKLLNFWGKQNIKNIKFGKIRKDGTRSVKFEVAILLTPEIPGIKTSKRSLEGHRRWTPMSYSYLTDIPLHKPVKNAWG